MSETWQSILGGGVVAIFAFALAMAWDVIRFRREQRQRDRAVLQCALAEIDTLLGILQNNLNLVEKELSLISDKQKMLLNPLDPVTSGFWDLVKIHMPQAFLGNADVLSRISNASRRTEQIAQMIRSREAFRISNQALSSLLQQMEKYDQLLHTFIRELIGALQELKPLLAAAADPN